MCSTPMISSNECIMMYESFALLQKSVLLKWYDIECMWNHVEMIEREGGGDFASWLRGAEWSPCGFGPAIFEFDTF